MGAPEPTKVEETAKIPSEKELEKGIISQKEEEEINLSKTEMEEGIPSQKDMVETIPLQKQLEETNILKRGRMILEFIKAKDLQKKGLFGKPDPYLKVRMGEDKFSSPVIKNNTNPEWKYLIEFDIEENSSQMLNVEVYDEDFGKDDLIGTVDIPLSELCEHTNSTKWISLKGGKAGSILYSSKFIPTEMLGTILDVSEVRPEIIKQEPNVEPKQKALTVQDSTTTRETIIMQEDRSTNKFIINEEDINDESDIEEKVRNLLDNDSQVMSIEIPKENLEEQYDTEVIPRKMVIRIIEGRNLKNTDLVGKADPYVVLKYKDTIYKSKTINNNLNPRWDFSTEVVLPSDVKDQIEVTVFDEDYGKDDKIGQTVIDISEGLKMTQERWISLDGGRGEICYLISHDQGSTEDEQNTIETSVKRPSEIIKKFEQIAEQSTAEKAKDETPIKKQESDSVDGDNIILSKDVISDDGLPALETVALTPGQVTLTVHRARQVENKGLLGKADPYVVVRVGDTKYRSETAKNSLNPEWNFVTNFDVTENSENQVIVEMYDDDFGKDDSLGTTSFDLRNLIANQECHNQWVPLKNCKSGEILISAEFKTRDLIKQAESQKISVKETANIKADTPDNGIVPLKEIIQTPKEANAIGMAKLTIHRGKKLEKRGMFGKANPYVLLSHKEAKLKSKTVKNTTNPDWDMTSDIEFTNEEDQHVLIEVFDDDKGKDDPMGQAMFNLSELRNGSISNKKINLEKCKSGQIVLSGEIIPLPSNVKKTVDTSKPIEKPALPELDIICQNEKTQDISAKKGAKGVADILQRESSGSVESSIISTESVSVRDDTESMISKEHEVDLKEIKVQEQTKDTEMDLAVSIVEKSTVEKDFERGQIMIIVYKARDIEKKGMFGKADPYVEMTYGTQKAKSATVQNNYNPEWDFKAIFEVDENSGDTMDIKVFDDDLGKDDILGNTTMDIRSVFKNKQILNKWVPLENCKSGEVLLSAEFIAVANVENQSEVQVSDQELEHNKGSEETVPGTKMTEPTFLPSESVKTQVGEKRKPLEAGQVIITIIKARDIEKKGMLGKADPYVEMTLGKQKVKSSTVKNNYNPEWNFSANFEVDEKTPEAINIAVFDDDIGKDDSLGSKTIDISSIQEHKQLLNQWIPLEHCKSGEILLSAEFVPRGLVQKANDIESTLQPESIRKDVKLIETSVKETVGGKVQDSTITEKIVEESETAKEPEEEIASESKEKMHLIIEDSKLTGSISKPKKNW